MILLVVYNVELEAFTLHNIVLRTKYMLNVGGWSCNIQGVELVLRGGAAMPEKVKVNRVYTVG